MYLFLYSLKLLHRKLHILGLHWSFYFNEQGLEMPICNRNVIILSQVIVIFYFVAIVLFLVKVHLVSTTNLQKQQLKHGNF
ncbi:hypothetical protein [uncultured Polaribacter sp.]|uniref:hypothetical protein n=1 Tax=uncultured Polaribacter sp. TaxID=174711 RepID=UPI0026023A0F|nr:hypothetical protein [uncultured Polaribacter sp.]